MFRSFPKCVLHGMRPITISTWQLQNGYGHRGGPHSSSSQSGGGRDGARIFFPIWGTYLHIYVCSCGGGFILLQAEGSADKCMVVCIECVKRKLRKSNLRFLSSSASSLFPLSLSLSQSIGLEYDLDLLLFFFTDFSKLIFRAILCFIRAFFFLK